MGDGGQARDLRAPVPSSALRRSTTRAEHAEFAAAVQQNPQHSRFRVPQPLAPRLCQVAGPGPGPALVRGTEKRSRQTVREGPQRGPYRELCARRGTGSAGQFSELSCHPTGRRRIHTEAPRGAPSFPHLSHLPGHPLARGAPDESWHSGSSFSPCSCIASVPDDSKLGHKTDGAMTLRRICLGPGRDMDQSQKCGQGPLAPTAPGRGLPVRKLFLRKAARTRRGESPQRPVLPPSWHLQFSTDSSISSL